MTEAGERGERERACKAFLLLHAWRDRNKLLHGWVRVRLSLAPPACPFAGVRAAGDDAAGPQVDQAGRAEGVPVVAAGPHAGRVPGRGRHGQPAGTRGAHQGAGRPHVGCLARHVSWC